MVFPLWHLGKFNHTDPGHHLGLFVQVLPQNHKARQSQLPFLVLSQTRKNSAWKPALPFTESVIMWTIYTFSYPPDACMAAWISTVASNIESRVDLSPSGQITKHKLLLTCNKLVLLIFDVSFQISLSLFFCWTGISISFCGTLLGSVVYVLRALSKSNQQGWVFFCPHPQHFPQRKAHSGPPRFPCYIRGWYRDGKLL